jgi:sulfhydrogenase subunit alpha
MVGALARLNINYAQLHPRAQEAADALGLQADLHNPYMNTAAQVVEMVHSVEESIKICDHVDCAWHQKEEPFKFKGKGGTGRRRVRSAARVLFHNYEIGDDGKIVNANCIIPHDKTSQTSKRICARSCRRIIDQGPEKVTLALEMLVRAYDPCISCSVHFLNVKFV